MRGVFAVLFTLAEVMLGFGGTVAVLQRLYWAAAAALGMLIAALATEYLSLRYASWEGDDEDPT